MTTPVKSGCLPIVLAVLLIGSIAANVLLFFALAVSKSEGASLSIDRPRFREMELSPGTGTDKIAVIPLSGMIAFEARGDGGESMVSEFGWAVSKATDDEAVKAILVMVNSGGGEVTASDELYAALKTAREKKPVLVYLAAVGASGAYYTAVGGTEIMAAETCFTGSIGVIIKALNYETLFDKIGLRTVTFKSGAFKDMLAGDREMTPEEEEYVQSMIMEIYERFVGIVATERKLDIDTLKNGVADGRVLSGLDAKEAGLVDSTGRIEDAYARARELGKSKNASIVRYSPHQGLANFFRMLGKAEPPRVQIDIAGMPRALMEPGRFYLMPASFATQP